MHNKSLPYWRERNNIETGDLYFTSSASLLSRIIAVMTGSIVSHVGMFIWIFDRLYCVESTFGSGVRIIPASKMIENVKRVYHGRIKTYTKKEKKEILNRVFGKGRGFPEIGTGYDSIGATVSIFYNTKSSRQFCSEYVSKILSIDFPAMSAGITPRDIANKSIFLKEIYD